MFYFTGTRRPDWKSIGKIDYDEYWRSRGFTLNSKLKEREEIILEAIPAGAKVLDIGCGNSRLPIDLKQKGVSVSVADISEVVLENYKALGIETEKLDLEKIKDYQPTGSFDWIILSEVLEHLKNPEEVILELKKHTRHFALTVPNSAFYRYRLHLFFFGRFFTQWVYHPSEHLRYWSHTDFLDWIDALGLNLVRTDASNGLSLFGLPLYKWFPNLFGHQICYLAET